LVRERRGGGPRFDAELLEDVLEVLLAQHA
jgi:hypothetical protein